MSSKIDKIDSNSKTYQSKIDLEEIFDDVLFGCQQILFADRKNPFEFLDPIISDSQCHIHSVFIISKLLQLYNETGTFDFKKLKSLPKMDRILLSYVVLFSVLKYEEMDEVGFVRVSQLIDYLGIISGRVNAERKILNQLKETFNSHSIKYLQSVMSRRLKLMMEECDVTLHSKKFQLKLQLQPCYVSFYAIFKFMEKNGLPIIIPLVRFKAETSQPDSKLNITSKSLLYFEFQKSKNSFVYKNKKNLSDKETAKPTIVITCFSVITDNYPEYFEEFMEGSQLPSDKLLTEDCDIRELLLLSAAGHVQLTDRFHTKEENSTEDYVKQLYKKHSDLSRTPRSTPFTGNFDLIEDNVYGCFQHHYKMAEKYGIVDARYSFRSKCDVDSNVTLVIRRNENTFFKFDHVNVSTYDRECIRINAFEVGAAAPLVEPENFNKAKAQTDVVSKLAGLVGLSHRV